MIPVVQELLDQTFRRDGGAAPVRLRVERVVLKRAVDALDKYQAAKARIRAARGPARHDHAGVPLLLRQSRLQARQTTPQVVQRVAAARLVAGAAPLFAPRTRAPGAHTLGTMSTSDAPASRIANAGCVCRGALPSAAAAKL